MACQAPALPAIVDAASVIPEIAIRLADEVVPLRAIARAIKESSDVLRDRLRAAQAAGRLLDLPRDDWPPGFPRDQRALQLSRLVVENRDAVLLAVQQIFHMTPTEVGLLLVLLQHASLFKDRIDNMMPAKTVDVHICRIRKRLLPYGIEITTLWGNGYRLPLAGRRKTMDMIMQQVEAA